MWHWQEAVKAVFIGKVTVVEVPEPDRANRKVYDKGFDAYVGLYKANKKVHRQIGLGDAH